MSDTFEAIRTAAAGIDLDPRTRRALMEDMDVSLLKKGGVYEVRSETGNIYEVDIASGSCTCLDWRRREPDGGCKHCRRVDTEIKAGTVPRPDGRISQCVSAADGEEHAVITPVGQIVCQIQRVEVEVNSRQRSR